MAELDRTYLKTIPREIPAGSFLVHNSVRSARRGGVRGSRFWLQTDDTNPRLVVCGCEWAPEFDTHHRVEEGGDA